MRLHLSLPAAAVLAASPYALAQTRPLLTEEADTARRGRIVVEAGADFWGSQPNYRTGALRDVWYAPNLNLVFSPAANVEIDVAWVASITAVDDPDFGTVSDFGDVTLRSKVRLVEEGGGRPALGVRFGVTLPETDHAFGLGPNTLRMSAQALLSKSLGRRLRLHVNAGIAIEDAPLEPSLQSDFLAYGLAAAYAAGDALELLAEVAGLVGHGHPGADERNEVRVGLRYETGRVSWDAAVRRGLSEADGSWGFTAGLTWTAREGR